MDAIRRDDVEEMSRATPEEKARQVLELMEVGIRLKRSALRARHTDVSEAEIEQMLQSWLDADDG